MECCCCGGATGLHLFEYSAQIKKSRFLKLGSWDGHPGMIILGGDGWESHPAGMVILGWSSWDDHPESEIELESR